MTDAVALLHDADALHSAQQLDAAAVAYQRALAEDNALVEAWYGLGCCHLTRLSYGAAAEALERIGRLYAIESDIRGRPPSERVEVRQARAGPELESLHSWLDSVLPTLSKKSELATAIRYALSRWTALT